MRVVKDMSGLRRARTRGSLTERRWRRRQVLHVGEVQARGMVTTRKPSGDVPTREMQAGHSWEGRGLPLEGEGTGADDSYEAGDALEVVGPWQTQTG